MAYRDRPLANRMVWDRSSLLGPRIKDHGKKIQNFVSRRHLVFLCVARSFVLDLSTLPPLPSAPLSANRRTTQRHQYNKLPIPSQLPAIYSKMSAVPGPVYGLEVPPGEILIPAAMDFPASVCTMPVPSHDSSSCRNSIAIEL